MDGMHGVLGIVRRTADPGLGSRFEAAFQRLSGSGSKTEIQSDSQGHWVCGRSHLGHLQPEPQGLVEADLHVWLHGDIHRTVAKAGRADAYVVADLYKRHGTQFARDLAGAYTAAIIDDRAHRLVLANDFIGSYPLYWQASSDEIVFSSSLAALLAASAAAHTLNLRAVADYLTIGFVLGDKTLANGVQLLGPGRALEYSWERGTFDIVAHRHPAELFQKQLQGREAYDDALRGAFVESMEACLAGDQAFGMSLSGGLDSRAILAAAHAAGRASELASYTLGVRGCADQVIAQRLATRAGTRHQFFELDEGYLKDFLKNLEAMVALTDGHYLSHGLTEMLAVTFVEQTGSSVLLRGHGGELAKMTLAWPLHTDAHIHALTDRREVATYLATRANYLSRDVPLDRLLTRRAFGEAGLGIQRSFVESIAEVDLEPADVPAYLYLVEHHRRYTVPSLELFRSKVEVRLPFVDRAFLRALFSAPAAWHDGTQIHRSIIRHGDPSLLRVRNSNTGAAADAGPLVESAMDKLNTLLKRANVWGYRHYHNFDGWMRRMLLDAVEAELLNESARIASFVERDTLRQLLQETRTGTADRGYLLQALLIIEIWQRQNGIQASC
jgi:asparagine synthase (glutamine-hydrolysing)